MLQELQNAWKFGSKKKMMKQSNMCSEIVICFKQISPKTIFKWNYASFSQRNRTSKFRKLKHIKRKWWIFLGLCGRLTSKTTNIITVCVAYFPLVHISITTGFPRPSWRKGGHPTCAHCLGWGPELVKIAVRNGSKRGIVDESYQKEW